MSDRLVTLIRTATPAEAHLVQSRLAAEGIDAIVAGETAVAALSYVGSALGGVKVHVRESDYERACRVLASLEDQHRPANDAAAPGAPPPTDWQCPECDERVPWEFDVCWACGTPVANARKTPAAAADRAEESDGDLGAAVGHEVSDTDDPASRFRDPMLAKENLSATDPPTRECPACGFQTPEQVDTCPSCGLTADGAVNPYRFTGSVDTAPAEEPPRPPASEETELIVARAFRATVLGTVLCPPLVLPYAMYLLLYIALQDVELSPAANRKYYWALFLNLLVGIPVICAWLLLLLGVGL